MDQWSLEISVFVVSISSSLSMMGKAPSTSGMFSSTHFRGSSSGSAPAHTYASFMFTLTQVNAHQISNSTFVWTGRSVARSASHFQTFPSITIQDIILFFLRGVIFISVQQGCKSISTITFTELRNCSEQQIMLKNSKKCASKCVV